MDDLFELSQIQSGTLSLALVPVALDEVLADAVEGAGVAARAKGVELACEVANPCPGRRGGHAGDDPGGAQPARQRHPPHPAPGTGHPHGRTSTRTARTWRSSVLDGCGGIPAEDIDRVFEMGYRGDVARTPGEGRGGLGLAVAQGLVQAHDGRISVSNEVGRVPLHRPPAPPPPDQGPAANRLTGTV